MSEEVEVYLNDVDNENLELGFGLQVNMDPTSLNLCFTL